MTLGAKMNANLSETNAASFTQSATSTPVGQEEAISPASLAIEELQETMGSALYETLEELGMALSGKLWEEKKMPGAGASERRQQALLRLVKQVQEKPDLMFRLPCTNAHDCPELERAQQIIIIASALVAGSMPPEKKRAFQLQLDALTAEEGWELAVCSAIELNRVDSSMLSALRRLMQHAIDGDEISLSEWFQRLAGWPDRRERVRILLRAMAFELNICIDASQQQRLAAVLVRLRQLLLFLGLEKECWREERVCQLTAGSLLPLLLDIIGERWLFSEWLLNSLAPLVTSSRMLNRLLHQLDALFTLLPDRCFNDDDQREQILETLRELKGVQALP